MAESGDNRWTRCLSKIARALARSGFVFNQGRFGRDVHPSLCFGTQDARERAAATPQTDRGHWNSLGLLAQEVLGRRHRRNGGCYPPSRFAAWIRGRKSVRGRPNVVGIEIDDPARKSTLTGR